MLRTILFLSFSFLMGCIDPVELKNNEYKRHLVVEGNFTNEAELNYVRLSYSQPNSVPYNLFEENAYVNIVSQEGEMIVFGYDKAGYYFPLAGNDASGKIGNTYTLGIYIGDKYYESTPTTLKEPVPIDSIHFEVDEQTFAFYGERETELQPGYNVLVDYKDPPGENNFLRWSFKTQYEVFTQPYDFIDPFSGLPAPKDCCIQCFLQEDMDHLKVIDDRLTSGKEVINQEVLFIPFQKYLGVKNKLTVYQHSITKEAYSFFRILEQQKESKGTVFDPPPAEIRGNMFNVNDENERVLGFFDVASVSVKRITILREDINYPMLPFVFADDCQKLMGATTQKPENW